MLIVAGLSLKNLNPRVWDPQSPYYLPDLKAVMVSYADFYRMPAKREAALGQRLHAWLKIPESIKIYLDNGAFYFLSHQEELPVNDYEEFVRKARPDWYPIPRDYIPTPGMSVEEKLACFTRTMAVNHAYQHDGFVPVVHIGDHLGAYTSEVVASPLLSQKSHVALGGIVPNLLRSPKALAYGDVMSGLKHMRSTFAEKSLHVFGIGGTATIHVAALLGLDSVDSAGWRNRAARGIIQLPGSGDRMVAKLGSWRGRPLSDVEKRIIKQCACPPCTACGLDGLTASGLTGFSNRATHNLWVLLEEARLVEDHLECGTYGEWYSSHLDNSTYRPLIQALANKVSEAR